MTGRRKTTEEFVAEAKAIHGDRFDYSMVEYERSDVLVTIICRVHGPFSIQAASHLRRSNSCLMCRGGCKPKTTEEFIKNAVAIHGLKYDYSQVNYLHCNKKVKIIYSKHGYFQQRPADHIRSDSNGGCPICFPDHIRKIHTMSKEDFIEKSVSVHGNRYDYRNISYEHSQKKVNIVCSKHGAFEQTPNNHMRGRGCPRCSIRVSKNGNLWLDGLKISTLMREVSLKFRNERSFRIVDGYDASTNTVYQFHGTYWHGHPDYHDPNQKHPKRKSKTYGELYKETLQFDNNIRQSGYNLVVMWEHDFKKLYPKTSKTV